MSQSRRRSSCRVQRFPERAGRRRHHMIGPVVRRSATSTAVIRRLWRCPMTRCRTSFERLADAHGTGVLVAPRGDSFDIAIIGPANTRDLRWHRRRRSEIAYLVHPSLVSGVSLHGLDRPGRPSASSTHRHSGGVIRATRAPALDRRAARRRPDRDGRVGPHEAVLLRSAGPMPSALASRRRCSRV